MIMATSPMSRGASFRGQFQNNAAVSAVLRVALAGLSQFFTKTRRLMSNNLSQHLYLCEFTNFSSRDFAGATAHVAFARRAAVRSAPPR
jgi:hypothetical protein